MMNRTMKLLLLSDVFVLTGFGLIQPILAIYINNGGVTGGTMLTAGMASALFLLTKSLVQLPFGHYVDSQPGKGRWLILGTLLMAAVPIVYLSASSIYHIYLAELIYGLVNIRTDGEWILCATRSELTGGFNIEVIRAGEYAVE